MIRELRLPFPDDFHAHLRQGEPLKAYAKDLAEYFGRALIMPNTVPPICSAKAILAYKAEILEAVPTLRPLMTFKIRAGYTEQEILEMKAAGAVAGKYYPAGVTTNSQDGIADLESVLPVLALMEKLGLVLCVHGEEPSAFCLDREAAFIGKVERLAREFPKLKIVFEHLSTAAAVKAVLAMPETVAATITVHHLVTTLDDILGGSFRPHYFCKPLPKRPEDKAAIREAAFSGNPKFFFGSDSAPHARAKKECDCCAAGVYTAPVALPVLAREFEAANALDKLPNFVGAYGADFYGLPRPQKTVTLKREPWKVPPEVNGVVPLAAGETLDWRLA